MKILGWITLAAAALTCGTIGVAIARAPQRITVQEIEDSQAKNDPRPGSHFDLGALGGSPRLIVALGTCMSCATTKTDFNQLKKTGNYRPVGVYQKGAEVQRVSSQFGWLELKEDGAGLHGKLNAFWTPRAYAFDSKGTLVAVQGTKEPIEKFIARLGVGQ